MFLKGGWNTATFVTNYMAFILFPILYLVWKLKTKVPIIKTANMDFISGLDEIEADTCVFHLDLLSRMILILNFRYDEPPPKNKWEAFWAWLVGPSRCPII